MNPITTIWVLWLDIGECVAERHIPQTTFHVHSIPCLRETPELVSLHCSMCLFTSRFHVSLSFPCLLCSSLFWLTLGAESLGLPEVPSQTSV